MTGPDHFRNGERLLAEAKKTHPFSIEAEDIPAYALLVAQANAHFAAAQAAATALAAALPLVGDDQQVTDWGRAVGATLTTNQGARIGCALDLLEEWEHKGIALPSDVAQLRHILGGAR